ncbi:MAG: transcriptional regulator NrdR [Ilumatobacter sp.]|nr:transcriptional regulator NrdR [bacterium]MDG1267910.1 transcriptional regulator NrdR [Ilumatobacter sp.]MDG2041120.1 transcriptional regulator NrdR [Ilumatobacter sp.]
MQCPSCRGDDSKVVDSRIAEGGVAIRRRRQCLSCSRRFTTFERVDHVPLTVVKSSGEIVPFDRAKVIAGLYAATTGRSVSDESLQQMANSVEDAVRMNGSEVSTAVVGLTVLDELRLVDDVSYLRFASVYKNFDAAADFHRELELMEKSVPHDGANG